MINHNSILEAKAVQIGIDMQMLHEILQLFFDKLPHQITKMQESVSTNQFDELHVISHTIKGTAANLFYTKISDLAAAVEQAALSKSCSHCTTLFLELAQEVAERRNELKL